MHIRPAARSVLPGDRFDMELWLRSDAHIAGFQTDVLTSGFPLKILAIETGPAFTGADILLESRGVDVTFPNDELQAVGVYLQPDQAPVPPGEHLALRLTVEAELLSVVNPASAELRTRYVEVLTQTGEVFAGFDSDSDITVLPTGSSRPTPPTPIPTATPGDEPSPCDSPCVVPSVNFDSSGVYVAIDCDTATPGLQSRCERRLAGASHITFTNTSGSAKSVGGFRIAIDDRFFQTPLPSFASQLDGNPDFNDGQLGLDWQCSATQGFFSSTAYLSCEYNGAVAPTVRSGETVVLATHTGPLGFRQTLEASIDEGDGSLLGSCASRVYAMLCYGASAGGFESAFTGSVSVELPPEPITPGSEFVLTVSQEASTETAGVQLDIHFDNDLLVIERIRLAEGFENGLLLSGYGGMTLNDTIELANRAGVLPNLALFWVPGSGITHAGSATPFEIQMRALNAGTSPLLLAGDEMIDDGGALMRTTTQSKSLTIVQDATSTPTPSPTATPSPTSTAATGTPTPTPTETAVTATATPTTTVTAFPTVPPTVLTGGPSPVSTVAGVSTPPTGTTGGTDQRPANPISSSGASGQPQNPITSTVSQSPTGVPSAGWGADPRGLAPGVISLVLAIGLVGGLLTLTGVRRR